VLEFGVSHGIDGDEAAGILADDVFLGGVHLAGATESWLQPIAYP
jgi:hypothetical protein